MDHLPDFFVAKVFWKLFLTGKTENYPECEWLPCVKHLNDKEKPYEQGRSVLYNGDDTLGLPTIYHEMRTSECSFLWSEYRTDWWSESYQGLIF